MKPREQIQRAHEDAVINTFLAWYNLRNTTNFTVIEKPDPPDAIAQDGDKFIWIEHADIYRSYEEAQEERSYVNPGEKPYVRKEHPIFSPDERTAIAFMTTLDKKISKGSYEEWHIKYGQGILILTERDPLFSQSTWACINEHLDSATFGNDKGFFKSVFFGYRCMGGLGFTEVILQDSQQINTPDAAEPRR